MGTRPKQRTLPRKLRALRAAGPSMVHELRTSSQATKPRRRAQTLGAYTCGSEVVPSVTACCDPTGTSVCSRMRVR